MIHSHRLRFAITNRVFQIGLLLFLGLVAVCYRLGYLRSISGQLSNIHFTNPAAGTSSKTTSSTSLPTTALPTVTQSTSTETSQAATEATTTPTPTPSIADYIRAITVPGDTTFPRLECPNFDHNRYEGLRNISKAGRRATGRRKFFFAANLHDNASILPRLLSSVIETIRFLGPTQCVLSIVEGRSTDGTREILEQLSGVLEEEGISYLFKTGDTNPTVGDRIEKLAYLRNEALEPMTSNPDHFTGDATVVFLNDVSICMEDILELIYQKEHQGADMICGMDWTNLWRDPTFYDVWIARGMNGDSFFEIPPDGSWNSAWNLLWNDPKTKSRLDSHLPFQVFACWNGGAVFTAKPFLEQKIKFRHSREGECYQGEPSIMCKEMWNLGYGKIAVVPSVNLEYSDKGAKDIKTLRGYVTPNGLQENDGIGWDPTPPEKVKCIAQYSDQTWRPWNEYLGMPMLPRKHTLCT